MKSVLRFQFALLLVVLLFPRGKTLAEDAEAIAWRITVPHFELRDASIEDSIRALAAKSRSLDPAHVGVNFVWPGSLSKTAQLNLCLNNIPLREVARYVGRLAGLRLMSQPHALIFVPEDEHRVPVAARFSPAADAADQLMLARVEFRDATLLAAIDYLTAAARSVDPHKQGVNVVLDVPSETRDARVTLSLTNLPFGEALRYVAEQANLIVVEETYALVVTTPDSRKTSVRPAAQTLPGGIGQRAAPAGPWPNPLAKPAEATTKGYVSRALDGEIQPEKSGFIPIRTMGGWPVAVDPWIKLSTDGQAK
jgi:hypothetical protein